MSVTSEEGDESQARTVVASCQHDMTTGGACIPSSLASWDEPSSREMRRPSATRPSLWRRGAGAAMVFVELVEWVMGIVAWRKLQRKWGLGSAGVALPGTRIKVTTEVESPSGADVVEPRARWVSSSGGSARGLGAVADEGVSGGGVEGAREYGRAFCERRWVRAALAWLCCCLPCGAAARDPESAQANDALSRLMRAYFRHVDPSTHNFSDALGVQPRGAKGLGDLFGLFAPSRLTSSHLDTLPSAATTTWTTTTAKSTRPSGATQAKSMVSCTSAEWALALTAAR